MSFTVHSTAHTLHTCSAQETRPALPEERRDAELRICDPHGKSHTRTHLCSIVTLHVGARGHVRDGRLVGCVACGSYHCNDAVIVDRLGWVC